MARRRAASHRIASPDRVYNSVTVSEFVNRVMSSGKKTIAERIVYGALEGLLKKQSSKADASGIVDLFERVVEQVSPQVEVRSRRVGGATYQVPVEVPARRRRALAMRWLIEAASKRGERTMLRRLAAEFADALDGRGGAVKKRDDVHKMAKANQAFAHYRWT